MSDPLTAEDGYDERKYGTAPDSVRIAGLDKRVARIERLLFGEGVEAWKGSTCTSAESPHGETTTP